MKKGILKYNKKACKIGENLVNSKSVCNKYFIEINRSSSKW